MNLFPLFCVALALAMDAFAVSLAAGMRLMRVAPSTTLRMAGVFGGFQFAMPIIGWALGATAQDAVKAYAHWAAFALLAFIGGKMIKGAWDKREKAGETDEFQDPSTGSALWLSGVATSLDALAVGVSLAVLHIDIWLPAVLIGAVCFVMTVFGLHAGRLVRRLPGLHSLGNRADAFGGLILLGIGLNILREHGVFS